MVPVNLLSFCMLMLSWLKVESSGRSTRGPRPVGGEGPYLRCFQAALRAHGRTKLHPMKRRRQAPGGIRVGDHAQRITPQTLRAGRREESAPPVGRGRTAPAATARWTDASIGRIVKISQLAGLHHRYERVAA